jgi:hypothetical protein
MDMQTWISQNKKWQDIPLNVKQAAKAAFHIPDMIRQQLLPSLAISVHQMLKFTLPRHGTKDLNVSAFFRKDMPNVSTEINITSLQHLTMPSVGLVRTLVDVRGQAWLDGYQSVVYAHLGEPVLGQTHYPLWVLTFWSEVTEHRLTIRVPWLKSSDWLRDQMKQKKSMTLKRLAEDANVILTDLPWGVSKCGLSDAEPIHMMHRYLGTSWTSVSQQNDMLELLRRQIASHPHLVHNLVVEGIAFTEKLLVAAADRDQYLVNQGFGWLQTLGKDIVQTKQSLLTVAHITDHRVAIVVDIKAHIIRYGDSFGTVIPGEILSAYRWWLAQHTTETFKTEKLPMTAQIDSHSCGYLANNGLHHYAIPDLFPLIQPGVYAVAGARIQVFNTLAEHMLE